MSSMETWAREEIARAGLFDADSDYDGMLGDALMDLIETFCKQGHSGMSAWITAEMFNELVRFKPLTPITNDPDEWLQVHDGLQAPYEPATWQNRRKSSCFSTTAGATYYDIDEPLSWWRKLAWKFTRKIGGSGRWEKIHTAVPG